MPQGNLRSTWWLWWPSFPRELGWSSSCHIECHSSLGVLYKQWNVPAGKGEMSLLLIKWSENQFQGHSATGQCTPAVSRPRADGIWEGTCAYHIPMVTCLLPLGCKGAGASLPCSLLSTQYLGQRLTHSRCSRLIVCQTGCVSAQGTHKCRLALVIVYLQCPVSS